MHPGSGRLKDDATYDKCPRIAKQLSAVQAPSTRPHAPKGTETGVAPLHAPWKWTLKDDATHDEPHSYGSQDHCRPRATQLESTSTALGSLRCNAVLNDRFFTETLTVLAARDAPSPLEGSSRVRRKGSRGPTALPSRMTMS